MAADQPAITASRFHSPVDDPSSLYYLHPSEGPGLVLVSQPLTGDNYTSWSRAFQIAITIKNKLCFIDGTLTAPVNPSPILQNAWIRNNNLVFSWIYNSISKEIQASLLYSTSAKSIWDELRIRFMQSNGPRLFQLRRDLANLTQDDLSVTQYYTKMKTLWDELSQFRPACSCGTCICEGVSKLRGYFDNECVLNFLMGLNEVFNTTRSQILLLDPLPDINRVFSVMLQEEKQRSLSLALPNPGNLLTMATRFDQNKKNALPFKKKDRPMCSHCNIPGHTIDQCFKIHGYPPGYKSKAKFQRSSNANQASIQVGMDSSTSQAFNSPVALNDVL